MTVKIARHPILDREEISELIDDLPERELHSVRRYLQFLHYLDDPDTLDRVEARAVSEDLKAWGKPKNQSAAQPATTDELKNLLAGIEDYRLPPASWFIRFTHATSAHTSKEPPQKGQDQ